MTQAKDALLEAARTVFLRHGYKKTSVAEIATEAGVAVGSVYKFYPSKQQLFFDVYFTENAAQKQQIVEEIQWDKPREAFLAFLTRNAAVVTTNNILSAWNEPSISTELHQECLKRCQHTNYGDYLHAQVSTWRADGHLQGEFTEEFLDNLLEATRQLDMLNGITTETKVFIIEAIIEKLFPEQ
ncbi:MAG: TetR/AcrR family transcriptional regulator [Corynebacterium sp.]|nr:TetR/AcrR family transcriptional regulator [Corynebacterium sp.]